MKNIFIVTSCIQPSIGVLNFEDRYTQTIETFDSIRRQTKDSLIVFTDSSVHPLDTAKLEVIKSKVDVFLDFSKDQQAQEIPEWAISGLFCTKLKGLCLGPSVLRLFGRWIVGCGRAGRSC
jgi:hypothetical protein